MTTSRQHLVKLSTAHTIERYHTLLREQNRDELANLLVARFTERYLNPVDIAPEKKSGFTIMAVSCLMIEALESFRRGWPNTRNKSECAFCSFFSFWDEFAVFRPVSSDFYRHVRCGILHQAETTGGWRILRSGALFDPATFTINATRFVRALRRVLGAYAKLLRDTDWADSPWPEFQTKMKSICSNSERPQ